MTFRFVLQEISNCVVKNSGMLGANGPMLTDMGLLKYSGLETTATIAD